MATIAQIRGRIEAFARQLSEEMGEVDESMGVCWLDAVENQAIEISDAVHAELLKLKAAERPADEDESTCPECGKRGSTKGGASGNCSAAAGQRRSSNRSTIALAVARLFFPMTQAIGVEVDCPFTPAMLKKIAYAGSQSASFARATKNLKALARLRRLGAVALERKSCSSRRAEHKDHVWT